MEINKALQTDTTPLHYLTPILVPCVLISCRKAAIKHEISAKVGHQFKANVPVSSN